ncbi:hypothetical protein D3C86_1376920 [compost metagenome]
MIGRIDVDDGEGIKLREGDHLATGKFVLQREDGDDAARPGRLLRDGVVLRQAEGKAGIHLFAAQGNKEFGCAHLREFHGDVRCSRPPAGETVRQLGLRSAVVHADAQRLAIARVGGAYCPLDPVQANKKTACVLEQFGAGWRELKLARCANEQDHAKFVFHVANAAR